MIFWIAEHLPAAFTYTSTRMALAAITSLLLCIVLGPRFIAALKRLKMGQPIRKEEAPLLGQLHEMKEDTPTMGGALILFSMLLSLLLWMDLTSPFTWILALTTLWMGLLGAIDDFLKLRKRTTTGLRGKKKFALQALFSAGIAFWLLSSGGLTGVKADLAGGWQAIPFQEFIRSIYLPFCKLPLFHLAGFLFVPWVILVVTGTSNAVNLTDGLDGLAAGSLVLVGGALSIVSFVSSHVDLALYLHIPYIEGVGEVAIFLAAMVGACVGFLWYNSHPAQVFMGDTGSLALGGILGMAAILLCRPFLLALVGGVFVAEALSVMLQVGSYRLRKGKRVFLCAPLHHHFEYKGWAETKVVSRFWIVGLFLAILGIASLKLQ